jgi:hypothetical protein
MDNEDRISDYLDDHLPERDRQQLHDALNSSPDERELFRQHTELNRFAQDQRLQEAPSSQMESALFARLQREEGMAADVAREVLEKAQPETQRAPSPQRESWWQSLFGSWMIPVIAGATVCILVAAVWWGGGFEPNPSASPGIVTTDTGKGPGNRSDTGSADGIHFREDRRLENGSPDLAVSDGDTARPNIPGDGDERDNGTDIEWVSEDELRPIPRNADPNVSSKRSWGEMSDVRVIQFGEDNRSLDLDDSRTQETLTYLQSVATRCQKIELLVEGVALEKESNVGARQRIEEQVRRVGQRLRAAGVSSDKIRIRGVLRGSGQSTPDDSISGGFNPPPLGVGEHYLVVRTSSSCQ